HIRVLVRLPGSQNLLLGKPAQAQASACFQMYAARRSQNSAIPCSSTQALVPNGSGWYQAGSRPVERIAHTFAETPGAWQHIASQARFVAQPDRPGSL